jgi:uncharacterized membrane protein
MITICKVNGKHMFKTGTQTLKVAIFSLLLLLNACTGVDNKGAISLPPTESTSAQTFVFTCSDTLEFVTRTDNKEAWLFLPAGTIQLPHTGAGSYRNDQTHLQINGQEASLEDSGVKHLLCKNDRRQAIWEHAKLNGSDYRATGNEPGWTLEIRNKGSIILITDYGSTRHEFTLPKPEIDETNRITSYQSKDSDHELILIISGEACLDTMSGEEFSSKATVTLDGKILQGCGRALH